MLFEDWKPIAERPKFADAVVIATLDQMHAELVKVFSKLGYHILCEKPMATTIPECVDMVNDVESAPGQIIFGVGHVLRYSPYNRLVKEVLDTGAIGDIVNIQHMEPVGNQHFAHSFVRGNWSKEHETTFALMAKCCHDLDILSFYLSGLKPSRVQSFGSIGLFKKSRKPAAAGDATRCLECPAEADCIWSAKKIYVDPFEPGSTLRKGWAGVMLDNTDMTLENAKKALETSPYGVCVYEAGNDVVDHQTVNIEYDTGVTATMTMSAFSESECSRSTVIQGTKGELIGDMDTFTVFDFLTRTKKTYSPDNGIGAHGGGDAGLAASFVDAIQSSDQSYLGVTPEDVLNSHLVVFAAEKARRDGAVVNFDTFKSQALAGKV